MLLPLKPELIAFRELFDLTALEQLQLDFLVSSLVGLMMQHQNLIFSS
jgi:hypothetical protein